MSVFITVNELVNDTLKWCKTLVPDFDVVVAIPRSGMIVGSIIATKFGLPLSSPDIFMHGGDMKYWWSPKPEVKDYKVPIKKILLVDDVLSRNASDKGTMGKTYKMLHEKYPSLKIVTTAVYITENLVDEINLYHKVIGRCPHRLEWNICHASYLRPVAWDMDGVICENCPTGVDEDEGKYLKWLIEAKPYLIPKYSIYYIITSRLEKYRPQTGQWLREHSVKYTELIMWNLPNKSCRTNHAEWKASVLEKLDPTPFRYYESEYAFAKEIHERTGMPVLCIETMELFE